MAVHANPKVIIISALSKQYYKDSEHCQKKMEIWTAQQFLNNGIIRFSLNQK